VHRGVETAAIMEYAVPLRSYIEGVYHDFEAGVKEIFGHVPIKIGREI
jgi:hypothetical protein